MIQGERVKQARELRAITQADLAQSLGVTQSYVAQIEGGLVQPSDEKLSAIVLLTGFPPAFLHQPPPPEFPIGSLLYRARAAATAAEKAQAHRYAQVMYELAGKLARQATDLPVKVPRIPLQASAAEATDPAHAAQITRATFSLSPDTPVDNLIRTLERAGIFVLAIPSTMGRIDAFSMWANGAGERPVLIVSSQTPGDRLRFSVAHELGHLVMHQAPSGTPRQVEQEADQFAAEFLLPEWAIRQEIVASPTLTTLAPLKPRWGVSIQALIRRAHELNIISEYQYRYLFEQLGAFGWRTREPPNLDVPTEKPRFIRQIVEMLYRTPLDYQRIANDVFLPASLVQEIIEAQAGVNPPNGPDHTEQTEQDNDTDDTGSGLLNILPFVRREIESGE